MCNDVAADKERSLQGPALLLGGLSRGRLARPADQRADHFVIAITFDAPFGSLTPLQVVERGDEQRRIDPRKYSFHHEAELPDQQTRAQAAQPTHRSAAAAESDVCL